SPIIPISRSPICYRPTGKLVLSRVERKNSKNNPALYTRQDVVHRADTFLQQVEENSSLNLLNGRPWYRKKRYPTQLDVSWMFKEALIGEGIIPTPAFWEGVPIIKANHAAAPPAAA
ncbi:MAG: hypothetical protein CV087_10020, partial [Candidatus Brocadia sp. WS118]